MESRELVGLEARTPEGDEVGRISEVLTDEENGEATHVVVERGEQRFEIPISAISSDESVDFATFHADRSDEEPGGHVGDEESPDGYAPSDTLVADGVDDGRHEGQFAAEPGSPNEAQSGKDLVREDWQDEESTPDSGYPRNDAYVDPDSGEEAPAPEMTDNVTLRDDVENLISKTGLTIVTSNEGVVELAGSAARQEDLEETIAEITGLDGVLEVDTTDVEVGG
ncbi:MAG: PRC-barrel domain-containing protein [Actinomycetota bacterium]|jgi:sporulation protein YlmC with PRC-barrel domain|nr:PRC-barrel domain-containing protein [Actinomycetota bacterium]